LKKAVDKGQIDDEVIPPILVALFICEKRVLSFDEAIEKFGNVD